MEQQNITQFWSLYDQYVSQGDVTLRKSLSELLMELEQRDKSTQILRPEKNWNRILAWQVLRNQEFIFSDTQVSCLCEGEIILWSPNYDRDVFLTRVPIYEAISGRYIKPGYTLSHDDKGDMATDAWHQTILHNGLTDERGLYLPIYDTETVLKLCDRQIALVRDTIKKSVTLNLHLGKDALKNL